MKRYLKAGFSFLLVLTLLAALPLGGVAAGTDARDGLEVTLLTNRGVYEAGEDVQLTVSVKNTNAYAVDNVRLEAMLPEGFEPVGELPAPMNISAGQTGTATLTARAVELQSTPVWLLWLAIGIFVAAAAVCVVMTVRRKKVAKVMSVLLCVGLLLGLLPAQASAESPSFTLDKTVTVDGQTVTFRCRVQYPIALEQVTPLEDGDIHPILE